MWEQYRKTAIWTQMFIVLMCIGLYWKTVVPPLGVALLFIAMELGAIIGAAWAARLRRRLNPNLDTLPLRNRL